MLLPIAEITPLGQTDKAGLSYKVFQRMEEYLRESNWCYYKYNSQILDILKNYKPNLNQYLQNPQVLKVISEKSDCGSMIRIKLEKKSLQANNTNTTDNNSRLALELSVIGENGEDLYFKESDQLASMDIELITQKLISWLETYNNIIPYKGIVLSTEGSDLTINMGKFSGLRVGDQISVIRKVKKRRHPLLKEIVDWKTVKIGEAQLVRVLPNQAQAKLVRLIDNRAIQIDDWVVINRKSSLGGSNGNQDKIEIVSPEDYSFGRLGIISVFGNWGSLSHRVISNETRKIEGKPLGLGVKAELWGTRNYWAGLELGRGFGTLKPSQSGFSLSEFDADPGLFKMRVGYKYLPIGFFYGPQVDFYLGYGNVSFDVDNSQVDGVVASRLRGLLLGVRGSLPIKKHIVIFGDFNFAVAPSFRDDLNLYNGNVSSSYINIEFGVKYSISPILSYDAFFSHHSLSSEISGANTELKTKFSSINVGATFSY